MCNFALIYSFWHMRSFAVSQLGFVVRDIRLSFRFERILSFGLYWYSFLLLGHAPRRTQLLVASILKYRNNRDTFNVLKNTRIRYGPTFGKNTQSWGWLTHIFLWISLCSIAIKWDFTLSLKFIVEVTIIESNYTSLGRDRGETQNDQNAVFLMISNTMAILPRGVWNFTTSSPYWQSTYDCKIIHHNHTACFKTLSIPS